LCGGCVAPLEPGWSGGRLRRMELDQLIGAYWQHYQLTGSTGHRERICGAAYGWANDLAEGVAAGSETGVRLEIGPVELMLRLAAHAPDEEALAYLGAGPVQSYLSRGSADLQAVDAAARQSARFRAALGPAWFDDHPPEDASRRRWFSLSV
jgi:hypothetical protein